jgi:putative ABC transport system permease protein
VLPLLALTVTTALATFAVTLDATASRGTADGAWRTVGADARLDVAADALKSTPQIAARIASAPGVSQVVPAEIDDNVRIIAEGTAITPSLVIVDSAAFARLLAHNPLPDGPDLARLKPPGGRVKALVLSGDGSLRPGMTLRLLRENAPPLELEAVGIAPAVNDMSDVLVVDAAAGIPYAPNTVWVNGPGAARAVAQLGHTVVRADVLHDRESAPLNAGMAALELAAAGTLLALGLLGFALSAAASAPERWVTLARLRTLGLRPRDTHRVAAAELLPPVLVAAVCGPLLGLLLVKLTFGALALRTLTGQRAEPGTAVPWWLIAVAAVAMLGTLLAVVAAEAAVRRSRRLGDVLRAGES